MLYIVIVVDVATTIPEKNPLFVGVVNAIGVYRSGEVTPNPQHLPSRLFPVTPILTAASTWEVRPTQIFQA